MVDTGYDKEEERIHNKDQVEEKDTQQIISTQATSEILDLLVRRGYFHQNVEPIRQDPQRFDPTNTKQEPLPVYSQLDNACQVFITKDGTCWTREGFKCNFVRQLEAFGGRWTKEKAAEILRVQDEKQISIIMDDIVQQNDKKSTSDVEVLIVGDEALTPSYLNQITMDAFESLQKSTKGYSILSDLSAQVFHLPLEITVNIILERLPNEISLMQLNGSKTLVTNEYLQRYKQDVYDTFQTFTKPTMITDICHKRGWDSDLILSWITDMCVSQEDSNSNNFHLPGELHGESVGAVYMPNVYKQWQRTTVDDFFSANGFLTAEKCNSLAIPKSKMGAYVKESFPSALVITECLVVNPDIVIVPLEAEMQEAVASGGFVDLLLHLPLELLEHEQDVKAIVNGEILSKMDKGSSGIAVISSSSGGALFVSSAMVRDISKKVLAPLVETYAKERAEQLDHDVGISVDSSNEPQTTNSKKTKSSSKETRKTKKSGSKKKQSTNNADDMNGHVGDVAEVVSIHKVVNEIIKKYPELGEVAENQNQEEIPEEKERRQQLQWIVDDDNSIDSGGILYQFCREALYTDEFISNCKSSIDAELRRLQSVRLSKASVSRKDAASKVRNLNKTFEECFATSCFFMQTIVKFIQFVSDSDAIDDKKELVVGGLKEECLQGACSDLANRVTQYCLFKNEVEDRTFSFLCNRTSADSTGDEEESADVPIYCIPIDTALRRYPLSYIACYEDSNSKKKDPLPGLRDVLNGSLGISVARLWKLCGGLCYQGGTGVTEDGSEYIRPGDFDGFVKHLEENCLSICGLPFKNLDKKSEKQFLFARRQKLITMLEEATESEDILELTIMLLFQQVKGIVVFGKYTSGPILTLLAKERKISSEVYDLLNALGECVRNNEAADAKLLEQVRACGLCRDISKHQLQ